MKNNTTKEWKSSICDTTKYPNYGKNEYVCHRCGEIYDVTARIVYEGKPGGTWDRERFEFPICTGCFWQEVNESMEKMDAVMLQRQIEEEKRWEKEWLEYEPSF